MPARAKDQLALDEQVIADRGIEAALEARQEAKDELSATRKVYDGLREKANAAIEKLELPEGGVVRVGRFRIARDAIEARSVSFETKASSRIRISLVEEGQAPARAKPAADDDADLRPKGPVDVQAIRNAASLN